MKYVITESNPHKAINLAKTSCIFLVNFDETFIGRFIISKGHIHPYITEINHFSDNHMINQNRQNIIVKRDLYWCWQCNFFLNKYNSFYYLGRCKSTFHQFLNNILDKVNQEVKAQGNQAEPMILPHSTWDKFGDMLANSGDHRVGLFDELVSFFSTMNMYSATKLQVSDTKEYQDFLQMYTGKAKTRKKGMLLIAIRKNLYQIFPRK